jgi:hypothetical protein
VKSHSPSLSLGLETLICSVSVDLSVLDISSQWPSLSFIYCIFWFYPYGWVICHLWTAGILLTCHLIVHVYWGTFTLTEECSWGPRPSVALQDKHTPPASSAVIGHCVACPSVHSVGRGPWSLRLSVTLATKPRLPAMPTSTAMAACFFSVTVPSSPIRETQDCQMPPLVIAASWFSQQRTRSSMVVSLSWWPCCLSRQSRAHCGETTWHTWMA